MRQQGDNGTAGDGTKLGLDQGSDLGLRLGDREVEGQRRDLVGGALLAEQLVAHLGAVPVRDYERGLPEKRPERLSRVAQVGQLLCGRAALSRADQRVSAQRDYRRHLAPLVGDSSQPAKPAFGGA